MTASGASEPNRMTATYDEDGDEPKWTKEAKWVKSPKKEEANPKTNTRE